MKNIVFLTRREQTSWVPPTSTILAYFHGGRVFTETLPVLARIVLVAEGITLATWWIGYWGVLFRDHERWSLVGAMLVHFALLALAYLFGRIAWLRLDHLRRIPPGEGAALRTLPVLLRVWAELFFIFAVGLSLWAFAMPAASPPPVLGDGGALATLGMVVPNPFAKMAMGVWFTLGIALCSLLCLVVFYGLANAVETYQAIELNSRTRHGRSTRHDDLVQRPQE